MSLSETGLFPAALQQEDKRPPNENDGMVLFLIPFAPPKESSRTFMVLETTRSLASSDKERPAGRPAQEVWSPF
jgi:hypothetical protein